MPEPITEIPDSIRSLPEEEQGPALVKAIHDRKAARRTGMDVFMEWVDELAQAHEEQEAMLRGVAARGLTPPEVEHSPAVIVHWACAKPTEALKPTVNPLLGWLDEVQEFAMQDSLLDRYRFPFL